MIFIRFTILKINSKKSQNRKPNAVNRLQNLTAVNVNSFTALQCMHFSVLPNTAHLL